ncbi:MAG: ATP-dependent zinc metalloprotease FtsH [Planctomycetota bacterium]|jgi:cell division protease FtsH
MPPEDEKEAPPRPVKKSRGYLIPFIVLVLIVGVVLLGQATKGTQQGPKFSYGDVEILAKKKHKVYRMTKAVMTEKGENSELKFWVVPKEVGEEGEGEEEGEFAATVTVGDRHEDIDRLLQEALGTKYDKEGPSPFLPFLFSIAPWIILIVLFWFFIIRQMRAPGGANVLSFGRSRARLAQHDKHRVTFADVAGIEEAKDEVTEIIEFLRNPGRFHRIGGRIPRGVLLVGPPGCGKTLLAKAIAGEAERPFYSISGSDFVEMFVGVGASRVRDLFKQAKENAPCIVFLDEIDAVGRRRGSGLGGGHDEREQTLNAILVEMDGFDTSEGIITLAATNRPDVLDPALQRPGRFDREIVIDLPDVKGREEILKVHARKVRLTPDVDWSIIARGTPLFSGAELEALINEAALGAVMKDKDAIDLDDLEEARDKVMWGRQKRSKIVDQEDQKVTAYHEAGHALLSLTLPDAEPLHKVTIIPRGMALGATMILPEKDMVHTRRSKVLAQIKGLFGGRAAEKVFFKDVTTGAANDLKRASQLARLMVTQWGMSDALGPVSYSDSEEHLFLGREVVRQTNRSEATAELIDREVKAILEACFKESEEIVKKNKKGLERIAEALIRYEVLSGSEVRALLEGKSIDTLKAAASSSPPSSREAKTKKKKASEPVLSEKERRALEEHGGAEPSPI